MANTLNLGDGNWATKEDLLLGYNSENNNFKPLPFNFSRGSNATVVNKDGLIETVGRKQARIDYKDNTKGALLLEPSRSNFIQNSSNLTTWNGAAMTRTFVDNLINPSNVLGGSKLTQTSSGGYAWLSRTFTGNETFSAFVKKDSSNFVRLYAANNNVFFDIVNGTIETEVGSDITDKSIINYGNGWFRISISVNSTAASYVRIYPASSGTSSIGTNSLFVYGAQLEQGYATSYIPTQGSVVTRLADNAYQQGVTQVIGQSEGTMYIDFIPKSKDDFQILYQIRTTGNSNVGVIDIRLQSGNITALGNDGGSDQFFINGTYFDVGTRYKCAIRYKQNDVAFYINGVLIGTDLFASFSSSSKNQVSFGANLTSFLPIANIIDAKLYNNGLSDSELQALTTI